jgi:hypothetical protein
VTDLTEEGCERIAAANGHVLRLQQRIPVAVVHGLAWIVMLCEDLDRYFPQALPTESAAKVFDRSLPREPEHFSETFHEALVGENLVGGLFGELA